MAEIKVPIGVSGRHAHVSREHLNILYGEGYELTSIKELSQPGQFAAQETIDLVTEKGSFKNVRILGPVRSQSQVEIALTDAVKLGLKPPVRDSGDLKGSPGVTLVGPKGSVQLNEGVIAACRHIHMTPEDAAAMNLTDKEIVQVSCGGERGLLFDQVLVRVSPSYQLEMHIDTDEGNAAMIKTGELVAVIKK